MHLSLYDLNIIQTVLLFIILYVLVKNRFWLILRRTINVCIHGLSKLVPKSKKLIVFGGENGMGFRGNPKYLFLELVKIPSLRCIWITKHPSVVKELHDMGFEAYLHHSLKGYYYQLRAKLAIHSHALNDDFKNQLMGGVISYNTWHGVGLKKVWGENKKTFTYKVIHDSNPIRRFFGMLVVKTNMGKKNYVVSTSKRVSSYYPSTFVVKKENVLELGQVRNDIFFKETDEDQLIPEWYRKNKVILYMPTHRNKGKLDKDINEVLDFEKINQLCHDLGCKFVIKMHLYSSGYVPKEFEHIVDISKELYDPQFLLKYADMLITDYSSCYTDYLMLDRPVIFYCYDLSEYLSTSNEMYYNYFEVTPGPKVKTMDELIESIKDGFAHHHETYKKERERVLNIFYSIDNQRPVLEKQLKFILNDLLKLGVDEYKDGGQENRNFQNIV
jgi:CDP-glycerol glycerophosphotransferase (TagB/SpsB family)